MILLAITLLEVELKHAIVNAEENGRSFGHLAYTASWVVAS